MPCNRTHAHSMRSQYEPGSAPYLALQATKERTQNRFKNYAKAGLLCGNDGLPHLISDPGLALRFNHAGEVFVSVNPPMGLAYKHMYASAQATLNMCKEPCTCACEHMGARVHRQDMRVRAHRQARAFVQRGTLMHHLHSIFCMRNMLGLQRHQMPQGCAMFGGPGAH
eukprot:979417-Pelagomonas_calceolata.AAC.3